MSTITQVLRSYPSLPYPLQVGNLQWSDKIEDYPSGEILYKGNSLAIANAIAAAYPDLRSVSIEDIGFVVSPGGVSVKRSRFGRGDIETYEVNVSLESKWKAKCQRKVNLAPFLQRDNFSRFKYASGVNVAAIASFLGINYSGPGIFYSPEQTETTFEEILRSNCRRLGCFIRFSDADSVKLIGIDSVGSYSYPDSVVIDSGSTRRSPILPIIDKVAVTGRFSRDPFDQKDALLLPIEPVKDVIIQGEDAHILGEKEARGKLKSLDSNFDVSGPKKIYTETTLIDNIVVKEVTKIYGFMYRAIDVAIFGSILGKNTILRLEGSPGLFWQQVEEQIVEHNYKSIPSNFNIYATNEGQYVHLFANPDSANVISVGGSSVVLNNAKYLLSTTTSGWKYVRFQKESDKVNESWFQAPPAVLADKYNALRYTAELCAFRKINVNGRSAVEAEPLRRLYGKSTPTPFTLDIQKYAELSGDVIARANIPAKYKTQNGVEVIDPDYVVGIVTANPTDLEPYWLKSETSFRSAFAYAKNAKFNPYLPDNFNNLRSKGDFTPEYIFTGDEAYTSVVRKVFVDAKDKNISGKYSSEPFDYAELYEEVSLNDTAQGANFLEAASDATKDIKKGKPPIAQVQIKKWGTAIEKLRIANPSAGRNFTYSKYYATSDLVGSYPADITLRYTDSDVIDLPNANTQAEARLTLSTDLRMVGLNNAIASKKLAWYYPNIHSGDRVAFSDGQLRVISLSNSLEFRGLQNGALMVVSEGTQVECGYDRGRSVNLTQATFPRNSDSQIAPEVRVFNTSGNGQVQGEFVYNTSQRRNFNA
jgi:hypothetical protein